MEQLTFFGGNHRQAPCLSFKLYYINPLRDARPLVPPRPIAEPSSAARGWMPALMVVSVP